MKILQTPVNVVMEYMICDCGEKMEWTGQALMSNPAQYPHKCNDTKCGKEETARGEPYPRIKYLEKEEPL